MNNAGGSHSYPLESWTLDGWANMIDLNLRSVFLLSQAAAKHMIERGAGAIVNISSGASQLGLPYVAPYGAAKAGVNNLTLTFAGALDAARHPRQLHRGRRDRVGGLRAGDGSASGAIPTTWARGPNAVGRAGRPDEIAYPILFLVSEASSFLSGETIYVGGGPNVPQML